MNRLDRIMISSLCLSMISGQTLRVCPEGKPVSTFPDHAVESRRNAPSQHDRRVERTIKPDAVAERGPAIALRERNSALERDDSSSNRHPALSFCLSMIFSENRCPLFRIMLYYLKLSQPASGVNRPPNFCASARNADATFSGPRVRA